MKYILVILILLSSTIQSQTETSLIASYQSYFEAAHKIMVDTDLEIELSIKKLDSLMASIPKNEVYALQALQIYKAKQERRIAPNKALKTLLSVDFFIRKNPQFVQLQAYKNTVLGRIEYEVQQNCNAAYKTYFTNLQALKNLENLYQGWNLFLETKTGIINSLICLQKDQEALEYLKQLENEIDSKTQLKETIYVWSVSGYIHTKFSNFNEGEKYFLKVIKLLENHKDYPDNYLAACNNLAHIYKKTNQTEKSIHLLQKAQQKAITIKDLNNLLLIQNNLGFLFLKKERYNEAEKLGLNTFKQANNKEFSHHKANANRLLGAVYYHLGNYEKATNHIDDAITYFRNFKNPELLRNALDTKNKLLLSTKKFESATKIHAEIISMLDSANLSNNMQNLQRELVAYESEKKNNEITILKQKEELSTFKIQQQQQKIQYLLVGLLILVIFGGIIIWYQKKLNTIQNISLRSKLTRSQFNPHYINNAFTSLQAAFVHHNFDEHLIDYTSHISRFSRLLLESTFKDEWSLYEEKQMMENYLKTQQYRLQNGFQFVIDTHLSMQELRNLKIPSAITQSVLENAIEHGGFTTTSKEGKITIDLKIEAQQLQILIQNNIIGEPISLSKKHSEEPSRGLDITKQRIYLHRKLYKKFADFTFSQHQNEVKVAFYLPIINL